MSAHPKGGALYQNRSGFIPNAFRIGSHRIVYFQNVISIDLHRFHAVANAAVGQSFAAVLLAHRSGKRVTVILNKKNDRQVPNRREVERLVKITLTCSAFSGEYQRAAFLSSKPFSQRNPRSHGKLGPQMRNHADNPVLLASEMK